MSETQTPNDPASTFQMEIETLQKYGYDTTKYLPGASDVLVPPDRSDVTRDPAMEPPALTEAHARQLAATLLRSGADPKLVEAALRQELGQPDAVLEQAPIDPALREWNRKWAVPDVPLVASDYRLSEAYRDAGLIQDMTMESQAEWQNLLVAGQVPPGIGIGLVTELMKTGRQYAQMTPGQQTMYQAEQSAQARSSAGSPEQMAEWTRCRDLYVDHLVSRGAAGILLDLVNSGALHSAFAFRTLANLGAALEGHRAGPPKGYGA